MCVVAFCGEFVIPRFKMVPGKFQLLLEELVGFFDNLAKTNSPHRNTFLGGYVFAALFKRCLLLKNNCCIGGYVEPGAIFYFG